MTLSEQVAKLEEELVELKQKLNSIYLNYGYLYSIHASGIVVMGNGNSEDIKHHYNYFKTKGIAEKVAKEQRLTNLIANIAYTLDDGIWKADWSNQKQLKYYIIYNCYTGKWGRDSNYHIKGIRVYMSESTADKVIAELTRLAPSGELCVLYKSKEK